MEYLTVGQMAEANAVSTRTLRLYHQEGLLIPSIIDKQNGRRYYEENQRYVLDFIQRLQSVGFSLEEIKAALSDESTDNLERLLEVKQKQIKLQELKISAMKAELVNQLEGLRTRREFLASSDGKPEITLSKTDEITIWPFDLDRLGLAPITWGTCPCLDEWNPVLAALKQAVKTRLDAIMPDVPIALLFHRAGAIYSQKDYLERKTLFRTVYLIVDPPFGEFIPETRVIPRGKQLSVVGECGALFDSYQGRCSCSALARELFAYAKKHHFTCAGECYIDTFVDLPALRSSSVETLYRVRLPIED